MTYWEIRKEIDALIARHKEIMAMDTKASFLSDEIIVELDYIHNKILEYTKMLVEM